ncbi:uncharacterized protein LOC134830485 [Culicoides brevitarsis]|uniref:uncharacterized protein LOC134830485 n=1 Tax=Culicoides brevitarsis TaxID=469753 RepID=UPI00307B5A01
MPHKVYLWADPISDGLVTSFVYHTTICIEFDNGIKYLFSYNDKGLNTSPAGKQKPEKIHYLGETEKSLPEVIQYAYELQSTKYCSYDVLTRNCNHFCNDLSLWLCGEIIPGQYIMQSMLVATNPVLLVGCLAFQSGSSKSS